MENVLGGIIKEMSSERCNQYKGLVNNGRASDNLHFDLSLPVFQAVLFKILI